MERRPFQPIPRHRNALPARQSAAKGVRNVGLGGAQDVDAVAALVFERRADRGAFVHTGEDGDGRKAQRRDRCHSDAVPHAAAFAGDHADRRCKPTHRLPEVLCPLILAEHFMFPSIPLRLPIIYNLSTRFCAAGVEIAGCATRGRQSVNGRGGRSIEQFPILAREDR